MAEYIERESFIEAQRHLYCDNCARRKGVKNGKMKFVYAIGDAPCRACDIGDMLDSIEDYIPAADVVPVRHRRWVKTVGENGVTSAYRCSGCGFEDNRYTLFNFCPNCGAKMDKDGDGNVS